MACDDSPNTRRGMEKRKERQNNYENFCLLKKYIYFKNFTHTPPRHSKEVKFDNKEGTKRRNNEGIHSHRKGLVGLPPIWS